MTPGVPGSAPEAWQRASIGEQTPRRRRRLGLILLGLGVVGLAAQCAFDGLLPYDPGTLQMVRRLTRVPGLGAPALAWLWALPCAVLLAGLARVRRRALPLAVAAGLVLGSAYAAAGGAAAAVAVLLLVSVCSLGWHGRRTGGLALLLATALTAAAWDATRADTPSLWIIAAALCATFSWIEFQNRRLFAALAERDSLITRLDQRRAELTDLQGARTRLLASISHDLRQPLQAVRLFAEALQSRPMAGASRWHELLRQQMRAADDAVAMLDQFSEFSAIEQGALQSHPEDLDLRDLLDAIAASLRAMHAPAALSLRVHGRPRWVHTDRSQLSRLVQNLAGNAVRYSLGLRAGRPARVVLALRPRRDADGHAALAIDVFDDGRGIPADQLEAVFEPYVQLAAGSQGASRGGRGLGLAIVRGLATQLGLQLAPVRSTPGRGTRFRVLVPAALCRDAPTQAPQAAPALAGAPARLDGWLLALLEDEAGPRAALRAALEGAGATIVDAPTLAELRRRLDEEPRFPDALVFDLDLGQGAADGLAAVDALRRDWDLQVPAVIVTGRIAVLGTVPLPRRCMLLGKPVALAKLVGALRRLAPERAGAS